MERRDFNRYKDSPDGVSAPHTRRFGYGSAGIDDFNLFGF